jgi:hypothetical protein
VATDTVKIEEKLSYISRANSYAVIRLRANVGRIRDAVSVTETQMYRVDFFLLDGETLAAF